MRTQELPGYIWNDGNIMTSSLTDKRSGKVWQMNSKEPDLSLPGETKKAQNAVFSSRLIGETAIAPSYLEAEVIYDLDKLEIKRIFRIYPGCSAIACDLYIRGNSKNTWLQPGINLADMVNLEKLTGSNAPVLEKLELPGKNWQINAVEFFDITVRFNTLVRSIHALSCRPNYYRGNLLFAHDNETNNGVFFLKEASSSNVQLDYPANIFIPLRKPTKLL
ncbi:MAG: hypothetical protein ABI472_19035 [Ginsengibacter sp.]